MEERKDPLVEGGYVPIDRKTVEHRFSWDGTPLRRTPGVGAYLGRGPAPTQAVVGSAAAEAEDWEGLGPFIVATPGEPVIGTTIRPKVARPYVELTIDVETAKVLTQVLRFVGGDPEGPRGQIDNLLRALRGSGLEEHRKYVTPGWKWEGSIHICKIEPPYTPKAPVLSRVVR